MAAVERWGADRSGDRRDVDEAGGGEDGVGGGRDVEDVITEFHALCEGIATVELRGMLPPDNAERLAHDAFEVLLRGMANQPSQTRLTAVKRARRHSHRAC